MYKEGVSQEFSKGELDAGPRDLAEPIPSKIVKPSRVEDEKTPLNPNIHSDYMPTIACNDPQTKLASRRTTVKSLHEMYDPSIYSPKEYLVVESAFRQQDGNTPLPEMSELLPPDPVYSSSELSTSRMTAASLPKIDSNLMLIASKSSQSAEPYGRSTIDSDTLIGAVSPINDELHGHLTDSPSVPELVSPITDLVSLGSPTNTLVGQSASPGDIACLWRLSSPPDPLLIPKQLHLRTNVNTPMALTTPKDGFVDRHISLSSAGYEDKSELLSLASFNIRAQMRPSTGDATWNSYPVSRQIQVEELRDLVKIINFEWMQRLSSSTELYDHCSRISAQNIFDHGIRSLESLFYGNFPRSFEDVFALMHVAFASAYILHKEHASYDWSDFFQDALQYQLALSSKSDRDSFLEVMDRWWLPPGLSLRASLVINFGPMVGQMSEESMIGIHQVDLLDLLRNSEIMRNCSEFLDGQSVIVVVLRSDYLISIPDFEEAGIIERNARFLPGALISNAQGREPIVEHMINTIIHPLQQQRGIEALREQMSDAEAQLHNGLLRNPREVEVVLISSGKVSTH